MKWSINYDDIIISRLIKCSNSENGKGSDGLFNWVREVKRKIPDLALFVDFTIATGLRLDEAINSYRLIVGLDNINDYYNTKQQILEHFRYKPIFIRRTKKAFMSFASKKLVNSVRSSGFLPTQDIIRKRLQRSGLNMRFGDLREFFASYSVKNLRQPEIDFLQGRVSASVFMRNYFNPLWIDDLKMRSLENIEKLTNLTK